MEVFSGAGTGKFSPFECLGFRVENQRGLRENKDFCRAMVMIKINGSMDYQASNGEEPIDALFRAMKKGLEKSYPFLGEIELTGISIKYRRNKGRKENVIVNLSFCHQGKKVFWSESASHRCNVLEAALLALSKGIGTGIQRLNKTN